MIDYQEILTRVAFGMTTPADATWLTGCYDDMAMDIHVNDKALAEYAATVFARDKRIEELECQQQAREARIEELERQLDNARAGRARLVSEWDRRTKAVVDATLRKVEAL